MKTLLDALTFITIVLVCCGGVYAYQRLTARHRPAGPWLDQQGCARCDATAADGLCADCDRTVDR